MSKFSCLMAFAVLAVFVCVTNAEDKKVCTPGTSYSDGCNTCTCAVYIKTRENFLVCTKNICPHGFEPKPAPEDFWNGSIDDVEVVQDDEELPEYKPKV